MIWAMRIFAVFGLWFVFSIIVFGILPALRRLRRRSVEGGGPVVIDDDDRIDAELRAFFDQDTDR